MKLLPKKIAIIGAGFVGSTTAFALILSGLVSEIILIDVNEAKAEGEALDLAHAASFIKPVIVSQGDFSACKNASIIIFAAGANQKPGETRLNLAEKNIQILKETLPKILKYNNDFILLMVSNPVDILTYAALKLSGLSQNKIIGSGTVLDSSRFRYILSKSCKIDPRNIHAYIIGEHGDTEFPVWSLATIGGLDITTFCDLHDIVLNSKTKDTIINEVRSSAYQVINQKGATYYAIALSIKRICEAILRDENSILTVSGFINDAYGFQDVCLSLPSLVNEFGREVFYEIPLSSTETSQLKHSAQVLKTIQEKFNF